MKMELDGIIHLCLLILLQGSSLAVVILNAVALKVAETQPTLISSSLVLDSLLLIMGVLSFIAATGPLVLMLRSRRTVILISELSIAVIMVISWTASASIVMTHFYVSSSCQLDEFMNAFGCRLVTSGFTLCICTVAGWSVLLIVASVSLTRLVVTPTFVLEANPYGYPLEKQISAAPSYTSLAPPPPSMSLSVDQPLPSYPTDIKYPIYSIDSLPTINVGGSKFDDLLFMH